MAPLGRCSVAPHITYISCQFIHNILVTVAYKQTDANRLTNRAKRYARVCRCKAELGSSDSALDAGCEQVPPDVTSQMLDLEQQLLYV